MRIAIEGMDGGTKIYRWKLSDNQYISVTFPLNSSLTTFIMAEDYDSEKYNDKAKITVNVNKKLNEKVKSGITYEEFKKYVGSIDGVLLIKRIEGNAYEWNDGKGSFLKATFSSEDNLCHEFYGHIEGQGVVSSYDD